MAPPPDGGSEDEVPSEEQLWNCPPDTMSLTKLTAEMAPPKVSVAEGRSEQWVKSVSSKVTVPTLRRLIAPPEAIAEQRMKWLFDIVITSFEASPSVPPPVFVVP
jgi:hypothetical protein